MGERTVEKLAAELHKAVETAQGHAYISDAEHQKSISEFFAMARGRLAWNDKASEEIRKFLTKHGELS